MTGGLTRFMTRKDGETADDPCGSAAFAPNQALPGRQDRVHDLRVRVPPTRLEVKPESNVGSLAALAKAIAARHPLSPDSEPGSRNKFDDTEFEESTISTVDGIAREQWVLHPQHPGQQYGGIDDEHDDQVDPKVEEGEEEQEEEDEEEVEEVEYDDGDDNGDHHLDHGNDLHYHNAANLQVSPAFYDEIAVARRQVPDRVRFFGAQSPTTANLHPQSVAVRSTSPVPNRDRPPSRPRAHQTIGMPPPARPDNKPALLTSATTTATKTNVFDKTSSYTDPSAEGSLHAPNDVRETKRKRPISDLVDYDPQTLKSLSFSDLDSQPFDIDPRRPLKNTAATIPPTEAPSSELHLQKLQVLKSLSSSDRERFFSSQTKDQWVASTEFFEKRLKELFDELRTARERRRDVAKLFEAEIRARMEAVERRGDGIERNLGEIREKAKGVLPAQNARSAH